MESLDLDGLKPETTVGLRTKGSPIFYSCTVLSVSGNKMVLSLPAIRDPSVDIMRKVELKALNDKGEYGPLLFGGTVNDLFIDSVEILVTSKQPYTEKRKNIRVPCELRIRYMELKGSEETWYTTFSINMSPGGIKMYTSRFHQEGDTLIFQFYIPEGYSSRSLLVRGRVVKIKRVADINYNNQVSPKSQSNRKYIVNVCFEGLSAGDYRGITRYIYSHSKG